jgi:hypothetical protein
MKPTFSQIGLILGCLTMVVFAVPEGKTKGKGRNKKRQTQEKILPPDSPAFDSTALHTWTATSGEKLQAKFKALQNGIVTVEKQDQSTVRFALARISAEDQKFASLPMRQHVSI